MKPPINHVLLAMLLTLVSVPAFAALDPAIDKQLTGRFLAADKNRDGKLTLEEAKAGMPRIARGFERIDVAKRGFLTLAQIKMFAAVRQQ
jgi:hypothetical protein